MKFLSLQSSIQLNEHEKPSAYMAMCMIESLFSDIRQETGADIVDQPMGDDKLATKMIFLYRKLEQLYFKNQDQMVRNLKRLNERREQAQAVQIELQEILKAMEDLEAVEAEYNRLCEELKILKEKMAKYLEKKAQLASLESEIAALRAIDFSSIDDMILAAKRAKEKLEQEYQGLQQKLLEVQKRCHELLNQRDNAAYQLAETKKKIEEIENQLTSKQNELEAKNNAQRALLQRQQELDKKIRDCAEKLNELQEAVRALEQEYPNKKAIADAEAERQEKLVQKIKQLDDQINIASADISHFSAQIPEVEQKLNQTRTKAQSIKGKLDVKEKELADTLSHYDALVKQRDELNDKISQIEDLEIPKLDTQIQDGLFREQELQRQCAEKKSLISQTACSIETLKNELPEIGASLAAVSESHRLLTAEYTAKSEEIRQLEEQISELNKRNGRQKQLRYKDQLQEQLCELQNIEEDCKTLEQRIADCSSDLQDSKSRYTAFLTQEEDLKEKKDALDKLIHELRHVNTPDFRNQVEFYSGRVQMLTQIHNELLQNIQIINQALPSYMPQEKNAVGQQLTDTMRYMEEGLCGIQDALVKCADCIRQKEW